MLGTKVLDCTADFEKVLYDVLGFTTELSVVCVEIEPVSGSVDERVDPCCLSHQLCFIDKVEISEYVQEVNLV